MNIDMGRPVFVDGEAFVLMGMGFVVCAPLPLFFTFTGFLPFVVPVGIDRFGLLRGTGLLDDLLFLVDDRLGRGVLDIVAVELHVLHRSSDLHVLIDEYDVG